LRGRRRGKSVQHGANVGYREGIPGTVLCLGRKHKSRDPLKFPSYCFCTKKMHKISLTIY